MSTFQKILHFLKTKLLPIFIVWFLIIWICFFWINREIDIFASDYMISFEEVVWVNDAVIILWSKVYANGALGAIVRDRADMAIRLYKAWKAKKILASADNNQKNYNETKAIYDYLIDHGVPKIDIFVDFAWFDTFDSLYRAKYNFQISSLLISNHLNYCPRSVYLARKLEMDAYCVTMPKRFKPRSLWWYYREIFAKIKAWVDINVGSKAYFASPDTYPISGTGNAGMFY